MNRRSLAVPAFAAIVACGHAALHDRPTVATDAAFRAHATTVRTIDVAPFDLTLTVGAGANASPAQLQSTAVADLANATIAALDRGAYRVNALVDWNGDAGPYGHVVERDALGAAMQVMASYQGAPARPVPLAPTSGADATLFISGWSFVPAPRAPRANHIANTIGRGVARTVGTAAEIAAFALIDSCACDTVAYLGATDEAVETRPFEPAAMELPAETGPSQLYLAMTLVDNRTGTALWHAHHQFTANAARPHDVKRAAETLLASLPRR